jgi:hypothetical protein
MSIDLTPTAGMREEAQRYRDWKAEGRDGGTSVAARRAGQILSGDPLSEQTVITMAAWFARHEVDKQGQGFAPDEEGYPSPGRVAWAAWGGDPGQRWSTAKADTIKAQSDGRSFTMAEIGGRPYPNEHAARLKDPAWFDRFRRVNDAGGAGVDFIYGIKGSEPAEIQAIRFDAAQFTPAAARKWLEDNSMEALLFEEATGERGLTPDMTVADGMVYEALEEIAEEVGQFAQAAAHYMPVSPFGGQGMVCSNCAFYEGPAACEIVEGEIAPGALCKFWVIPPSKLAPATPAAIEPAQPAPQPRALTAAELRTRCHQGLIQQRDLAVTVVPGADGGTIRWEFSSEQPVERYYGREILSHAPGAADLSRLNNGGLHLWNHNPNVVLGRVMEAGIGQSRRGEVVTRWSPNTMERGSEEWKRRQDIESGTTTKSSFAYEINEAMDMGDGSILVTRWTGLEVSTVSIPADNSVGHPEAPPIRSRQAVSPILSESVPAKPPAQTMTIESPPNVDEAVRAATDQATDRAAGIVAVCAMHGISDDDRDTFLRSGRSLDQVRSDVLERIGKRSRELQPGGIHVEADALIGMDRKDLRRYSPMNVFRHLADPNDRHFAEMAAFEIECSREQAKKLGKGARGLYIPFDWMVARRDQTVGNFSAGGALVGTELLAGSFIETLRNQSALLDAGITMITGLTQNVEVPRRLSSSQHYWVGEGKSVTKSDQGFGSIAASPKNIAVRVGVSRQTLLQANPDMDTLTQNDMSTSISLGIDSSGFYGTGTGSQPLGLRNVTGIGGGVTFSGGDDMIYPTELGGGTHNTGTYRQVGTMRASAYGANVQTANCTYWMNGVTMNSHELTLKFAGTDSSTIINDLGNIGRFPVKMSNQVQSNDVFFGDPVDLALLLWGGLDVIVDNITQASEGIINYNMIQSLDWVCRNPKSFSYAS